MTIENPDLKKKKGANIPVISVVKERWKGIYGGSEARFLKTQFQILEAAATKMEFLFLVERIFLVRKNFENAGLCKIGDVSETNNLSWHLII